MNKLFTTEQTPFILSILLAIATYFFNNVVKIAGETPTMAYRVYEKKDTVGFGKSYAQEATQLVSANPKVHLRIKALCFELINLSSKNFKKTEIIINQAAGKHSRLFNPEIVSISPSGYDTITPIDEEHKFLIFDIFSFHPDCKCQLEFVEISDEQNTEYPLPYVYSDDPVRFVKYGLREFLLENKFVMNISLFSVFILLVGFYVFQLFKNKNHDA